MAVPSEKIALFIDGANLYATAKSLGFDIDYKRLLQEFQSRGYLLRAFYYTAVIEDQEYSSIRPLIDWLDYNGYTVVTKATKEFVDQTGRRKVKGNMDIELAVDAMELAGHDRSHGAVFRRRRFPFAGRGRAAPRRARHRRFHHLDAAADGRRRVAPAGRRIHRHRQLQDKIGRDPAERAPREAGREPRQHTPQFLQRGRRNVPMSAPMATTTISRTENPAHVRDSGKPGRDCPLCPRLVAFRNDWRKREPGWFNAPVASFGPNDAPPADRRSRARTARRQPHRPALHRRLCRRPSLRHADRIRLRARQSSTARPDDSLETGRCPHHQCGALRAAGKQADAAGDQHLPQLSRRRPSPK